MDSTIKGNLLARKLGIMTFGPYIGTLESAPYLTFKVSIGPVELGNYTFQYNYLTYESIQHPKNDAKLGEGWHLKSKLETIWPVVFQDYDLFLEIYALREKLNQKPLAFKTCNH
uniref:Uncharacterized protein n=1 Tax=Cacopsylla melanoneura TaxID=428564 RepID=A0A8D8RF80_9HEMI